jgi:hypothetical protein
VSGGGSTIRSKLRVFWKALASKGSTDGGSCRTRPRLVGSLEIPDEDGFEVLQEHLGISVAEQWNAFGIDLSQ